jgi:ABC-type sugar transport system ATPase subunit
MSNTPAVEIRGLSKTFPGQRALIDVDLEVQPGEVRALVGQNGCGKSTLIKILAGYHEPDPGVEVFVDGNPLALGTTGAGDHAGIRFVHQDLGLVPTLDTRDNLAMGHGYERNKLGLISWRREQRLARDTLRGLGYDFDVRQPTSHLVISQRTAIALARDLRTDVLAGVDLEVRPGEILGVAGITGSGREEIALALFGGLPRTGTVSVAGKEIENHRPDKAVDAGIALVPAERHANAAFLESTLRENVSIVNPGDFLRRGLLSRKREVSEVTSWLQKLKVKPPHPERVLATLSGGNQQKVMLARWLRQKPKVLLLDEPTQGVDVGAKADIHLLVEEAAIQGAAVVIVSTDHSELTRLAERVVVLRNGRVADVLVRPHIDPDRITAATIGQKKGAAA